MKFIVANIKQNGDERFFCDYAKTLGKLVKNPTNLLVAIPSVYLHLSKNFAKHNIVVGAQNISSFAKGAYTGEVGANMVKEMGCQFTIVGHSERRNLLAETNEQIKAKINQAKQNSLTVILCVGENLEDRKKYKSILASQIDAALSGTDLDNIMLAYEPVWAISTSGTGKIATIDDIKTIHAYIKEYISKKYNTTLPILYGGSVKPSNCEEILALDCVDGVLVGGASLKPEDFAKIYLSQK